MMKVQGLAIAFSIILQQVHTRSVSLKEANQQLFQIGQQMGLRVADEYNDRKSSFLSPAETVKSLLVNCTLQMMGIKLQSVDEDIAFEKRVHRYNLNYRQSSLEGSILTFCTNLPQNLKQLAPSSIVCGFLYGILRTVDFYGTVIPQQSQKSIIYRIQVQKDIKQDD